MRKQFAASSAVMAFMFAPTSGTGHTHTCRGPASPNLSSNLPGRSCGFATRVAAARRPSRQTGYVVSAAENVAQLKMVGEVGSQSHSLSLRTADPLTATGLVHRSLVTEAQNSRKVSSITIIPYIKPEYQQGRTPVYGLATLHQNSPYRVRFMKESV